MSVRSIGAQWIWLLLAAAAMVAAWSLATGVASVLEWRAERLSATLPGGRLSPGSPQDQAVRDLLRWAQRLDPGNPLYGQRLGQHLERLALKLPPRSKGKDALLAQARAHYVQAARRRPTWPLSLVPILRTDIKLGQVGPQFNRLYRRTYDLGRSEPAALWALVDLGLVAWPLLDADGREAVSDLLAHGLLLNPRRTLERVAELDREPTILPLVSADARLWTLYREIVVQSPVLP